MEEVAILQEDQEEEEEEEVDIEDSVSQGREEDAKESRTPRRKRKKCSTYGATPSAVDDLHLEVMQAEKAKLETEKEKLELEKKKLNIEIELLEEKKLYWRAKNEREAAEWAQHNPRVIVQNADGSSYYNLGPSQY